MSKRAPNPVDVAVGRNIRFYRLAAGMSQATLGERIGLTFQQVQKYEKGTNRAGASRLSQIAGVLGIPIIKLFDGVPAQPGAKSGEQSTPGLLAEPRAFRLANAFAGIHDTALRQAIVNLVEKIAAQKAKH